jgi:hypothetical protein
VVSVGSCGRAAELLGNAKNIHHGTRVLLVEHEGCGIDTRESNVSDEGSTDVSQGSHKGRCLLGPETGRTRFEKNFLSFGLITLASDLAH